MERSVMKNLSIFHLLYKKQKKGILSYTLIIRCLHIYVTDINIPALTLALALNILIY